MEEGGLFASLSRSEALRRYDATVTALASHGLAIPPASRLAQFRKLLDPSLPPDLQPAAIGHSDRLRESVEASRDFAEFATIVRQLVPTGTGEVLDGVLRRKLREIIAGASLPSRDSNPLHRSTQFELYLAAVLTSGGIPVRLREPDGILTLGEVTLGLAAKRPNGPSHVIRVAKSAAKQIRRANVAGIVAISFDRICAPNDALLVGSDARAAPAAAKQILDHEVTKYVPGIKNEIARHGTLALWMSAVASSAVPSQGAIGRIVGQWVDVCRKPSSAEQRALDVIFDALRNPPE